MNMNRLLSIDFLRGFVVLLMTIDHSREFFSSIAIGAHLGTELPPSYYFIRWITHFCAPTFAFLAGLSMALRPIPVGESKFDLQIFMAKRGLFLILLCVPLYGLLYLAMGVDTVFTIHLPELWSIGFGMMFVSLMMYFRPSIVLAVSLLLVVGHHLLEVFDHSDSMIWSMLHVRNKFVLVDSYLNLSLHYPILPWLGIVGLGYALGYYFFSASATLGSKRQQYLLIIALCSFILFVILRYTNLYGEAHLFVPSPDNVMQSIYSFLDVTKYPPSLLFVLIMLIPSCVVLAFSESRFFQQPNRFTVLVSQYGKAALFYYVLHLWLIAFYAYLFAYLFNDTQFIKSDHLGVSLLVTVLVIVTAYPIVRGFTFFRHRYRDKYPFLAYW